MLSQDRFEQIIESWVDVSDCLLTFFWTAPNTKKLLHELFDDYFLDTVQATIGRDSFKAHDAIVLGCNRLVN